MAEFQHSMSLPAAPKAVFDFVANIANMPSFLPTTQYAEARGPNRVFLKGEAKHHAYEAEGNLHRDAKNLRLEWSADERHYAGWMQISAADADQRTDQRAHQRAHQRASVGSEGNGNHCRVTVHLSFGEMPGAAQGRGATDSDVRDGIEKALQSICNQVLKRGGKVEPVAAT